MKPLWKGAVEAGAPTERPAHLFLIPLDNQREWFRYHHLFADLLRYCLRREQPERVELLQRRAYQWQE